MACIACKDHACKGWGLVQYLVLIDSQQYQLCLVHATNQGVIDFTETETRQIFLYACKSKELYFLTGTEIRKLFPRMFVTQKKSCFILPKVE